MNTLVYTKLTELLVIPAALYLYHLGIKSGRFTLFKREIQLKQYIVIALGGMIISLFVSFILTIFSASENVDSYRQANGLIFTGSLILQILVICLISPLAEELIFRGLIYHLIKYFSGNKFAAVFISAVLFGIYHGNIIQGITGFLIGLLLGVLYERFGTLKSVVLFHICFNFPSVILQYFFT